MRMKRRVSKTREGSQTVHSQGGIGEMHWLSITVRVWAQFARFEVKMCSIGEERGGEGRTDAREECGGGDTGADEGVRNACYPQEDHDCSVACVKGCYSECDDHCSEMESVSEIFAGKEDRDDALWTVTMKKIVR